MIESDIRLEKALEAILNEVVSIVGPKHAESCPAVIALDHVLEVLKETNNSRIAAELGIKSIRDWKCPCQGGKE